MPRARPAWVRRSTSTAMSRTIFERGRWWLIEPPRLTEAAAASQSEVMPPSALRCSAFSASASDGAGPNTRLARRLRMIRGCGAVRQLGLDLGGERAGRQQRRHGQFGDHQHLVGAGQHVQRPGLVVARQVDDDPVVDLAGDLQQAADRGLADLGEGLAGRAARRAGRGRRRPCMAKASSSAASIRSGDAEASARCMLAVAPR